VADLRDAVAAKQWRKTRMDVAMATLGIRW